MQEVKDNSVRDARRALRKEFLKKEITCDCGTILQQVSLINHMKGKIHLDRMNFKINNPNMINEEVHKRNEQKRKNKEKRRLFLEAVITCDCGESVVRSALYTHVRSHTDQQKAKQIEKMKEDVAIVCECGEIVVKSGMRSHKHTSKHLTYSRSILNNNSNKVV